MRVQRKDATITNTDEDSPGSFRVILSAPTLDRDGDQLTPDGWKTPLPGHITFDIDHGMSVASTVGSRRPHIDDDGNLIVEGTYSSLPRAQEVRTLVNEGHIRTTSVAFMTEKDSSGTVTRELLNGAFVAIPANREALVLESKAATTTPTTASDTADPTLSPRADAATSAPSAPGDTAAAGLLALRVRALTLRPAALGIITDPEGDA